MTNNHRELTDEDFASAIPARLRRRLVNGQFESGKDIAALRRFVRLTQVKFAEAMGILVIDYGDVTPDYPSAFASTSAGSGPKGFLKLKHSPRWNRRQTASASLRAPATSAFILPPSLSRLARQQIDRHRFTRAEGLLKRHMTTVQALLAEERSAARRRDLADS